jgi:hypothetical protein
VVDVLVPVSGAVFGGGGMSHTERSYVRGGVLCRHFSPDEDRAITSLRLRGLTLGQLARKMQRSKSSVQMRLRLLAEKAGIKVILGCDPGASGALALFGDNGELVEVVDMPVIVTTVGGRKRTRVSAPLLSNIVSKWKANAQTLRAVVEFTNARSGGAPSSSFAFGFSTGARGFGRVRRSDDHDNADGMETADAVACWGGQGGV